MFLLKLIDIHLCRLFPSTNICYCKKIFTQLNVGSSIVLHIANANRLPLARVGHYSLALGIIGSRWRVVLGLQGFQIQTCWYQQCESRNAKPQHEWLRVAVEYRLKCTEQIMNIYSKTIHSMLTLSVYI